MVAKADPLDRRQRIAAALLLTAVDFPLEVSAWAPLLQTASDICVGLRATEPFIGDRRRALEKVREIVAEMLAEIT